MRKILPILLTCLGISIQAIAGFGSSSSGGSVEGASPSTFTVTSLSIAGSINGTSLSGWRNRIINGDMRIDQANEGTALTVGGNGNNTYLPDMFFGYTRNGSGKWVTQISSATPPNGFKTYSHMYVSSAIFSSTAADEYVYSTRVEGYNFTDSKFGTSDPSYVTASFYVRSSSAGVYSFFFGNNNTHPYVYCPTTYTINTANTWEKKTITMKGDTSPNWFTGEGEIGLKIGWDFCDGSSLSQSTTGWSNDVAAERITGTNCFMQVLGSTFDLTGVQLELGSNATAFEFRPFETERRLCERYYEKSYANGVKPGSNTGNGSGSNVKNIPGSQLAATETDFYLNFHTRHFAVPTMTFYSKAGTSGKLDCFTVAGSGSEVTIVGTENDGTDGVGFYQTTALDYMCSGHFTAASRL